jgi:hypothetical protein
MIDAQIDFPKILKPIPNFEALYQGQPGQRVIAFPGGIDQNSEAGIPGYASNLQRGVEVPFGARLVIWIPICADVFGIEIVYRYRFIWRLRNVTDYRLQRRPYHLPDQRYGIPDSTVVPPAPRYVVPSGSQQIIYEQVEPDNNPNSTAAGTVRLRNQWFEVRGGTLNGGSPPLDQAGNETVFSQGVMDPAVFSGAAGWPLFNVFRCDAEGDELIILCTRGDTTDPWDFQAGGWDNGFANLYGTGNSSHESLPNVGIYVFSGINP